LSIGLSDRRFRGSFGALPKKRSHAS